MSAGNAAKPRPTLRTASTAKGDFPPVGEAGEGVAVLGLGATRSNVGFDQRSDLPPCLQGAAISRGLFTRSQVQPPPVEPWAAAQQISLGRQDRCGSEPVETGVIAFEWPSDPAAAIDCSLLIFDGQDLQTGLARREEAFQRIADCQASGSWPSHGRHAFRPAPSSFSLPEREELDQDSIDLF